MRADDEVIDRAPEEGARVVALTLLAKAEAAAERYRKAEDEEALHDFRVALRRLRSTLRAFRPWLRGGASRRLEKKLEKCARATNAARDAEVQLAWLESKRDALARRHQAGLDAVVERLEARRGGPDAEDLAARYGRAARKLGRRLSTYERHVEPGGAAARTRFAGVLATLLDDHLVELRDRVEAIRSATDVEGAHRARIAGKRLRYLLEPLSGNRHADASAAVKELKRLQDVLGELHDSHVLGAELADLLVEVTGQRAREVVAAASAPGAGGPELRATLRLPPRDGVVALARLAAERRDTLHAELEREWRAHRLDALSQAVRAVSAALEARAGGRAEQGRRFLLSSVPPRAAMLQPVEIAEGWVPGERLHERIWRVRSPDGERHWRALDAGGGPLRVELLEETSRELFEALWPATVGRRLVKRRRSVEEEGVSWDVDELEGRDLVLASAALAIGHEEAPLPDWLRAQVVRDVTDDATYLDETLAVAPSAQPAATPSEGAAPAPASPTAQAP